MSVDDDGLIAMVVDLIQDGLYGSVGKGATRGAAQGLG